MIATSKKSGSSNAAWWAVLSAALGLIAYLLLFGGKGDEPSQYGTILNRIIDGRNMADREGPWAWLRIALVKTVCVVAASVALSFAIGVVVGVMQLVRNRIVRFLGTCYVEAIRGIPIFVMLLFVYFGIRPMVQSSDGASILNAFWCAVLALGVCYGSYMAEVIRAGILAIPVEEIEAGSLEGSRMEVLRFIILTQGLRIILPALANECIGLTKDSSLVGIITVAEITRTSQIYAGSTYRYFETYTMLALVYLVLSLMLSRAQRSLEANFGDAKAHLR